MSKTIRYDALLVRALAAELGIRLGGARLHAVRLDRAGRTIRLATGRGTVVWSLHPQTGGLHLLRPARESGNIPVRAESRIGAVGALPDDRVLEFEIGVHAGDPVAGGLARLVVELFGTHSNAFALDAAGSIIAALRRGTGARTAEPGSRWMPPSPSARAGVEKPLDPAAFGSLLRGLDPGARRRALIRDVAWCSPINAAPIVGPAGEATEESALEAAYGRYLDVCYGPPDPVLLDVGDCLQPYSRPLPGVNGRSLPDLLTAFDRAGDTPEARTDAESALAAISARRESLSRRCERLRAELDGALEEAARLRGEAGLLLSRAPTVKRGQAEAWLDSFDGGKVRIELDPTLDAAANAERIFDHARKRERAARRIPALLDAAAAADARLAELAREIEAGGGRLAPEQRARLPGAGTPDPRTGPDTARLPYRRYRSRSGLEIRVGRGAGFNDELTLRHTRPDDIWMHARDAAGAHVVLVWGRRDQHPSEGDLQDAALLAALHSKARTSNTVPVDWTRKKYVRKPRKTPPGTVVMERARTLFVRPDPEAVERLRLPADQD